MMSAIEIAAVCTWALVAIVLLVHQQIAVINPSIERRTK